MKPKGILVNYQVNLSYRLCRIRDGDEFGCTSYSWDYS